MAQPTHHIEHKDGRHATIAITTDQLNQARSGSDRHQKSIAIAVSHDLWQNDELTSRSPRRPYIDYNDLIIEDLSPSGHRD